MADKTYNGWTNYETWAVKLWLDNEQGDYYYVTGHAAEFYDEAAEDEIPPSIQDFADWLKTYVTEEKLPELDASLASDLLNAAMSEVDWNELAEAYLADAKQNAQD